MPAAISASAARAATQSGKPVKGSTPEPTEAIAPRTPPAGSELPEAVTPSTPPAAEGAPPLGADALGAAEAIPAETGPVVWLVAIELSVSARVPRVPDSEDPVCVAAVRAVVPSVADGSRELVAAAASVELLVDVHDVLE